MTPGTLVRHRWQGSSCDSPKKLGIVVSHQAASVYLHEVVFILWHGSEEIEREFPHSLEVIKNEVR
jgi:hypothetical protein